MTDTKHAGTPRTCEHPFVWPNGDCVQCGVFVTTLPAHTEPTHTMLPRKFTPLISALAEENALLRKALSADLWLVWSHEHGAWWNPNKCGYTNSVEQSGRYSLADALSCCKGRSARKDGLPNEIPVPSPELIALQCAALEVKP